MAHKTITISEEAYRELAKIKGEKESFTDAILRLTSERGSAKALLSYLERVGPSEELARNVGLACGRTRRAGLRRMSLG
jgi:predicted CopG family antitoxin